MTDYYPLLSRAVSGLEKNTGEARRALYERARNALVAQLRSTQPPLPEADITRERLALEDAVRKVEADEARRLRTPPGTGIAPPPPAPPTSRPPETPPRAPVPRPEDLRRQSLPPAPASPPSTAPRGAPPPPSAPRSPAPSPPRPAVPPGMQPARAPAGAPPRAPEQRPAAGPGVVRPPEPRPPVSPPPAPPPPEVRRPPPQELPRARQAPPEPPRADPFEQPLQPARPVRPDPRDYPTDLDDGATPPPSDAPVRRRRPPGPAPRRPLGEEKPANPGRRGLIAAVIAILIIGGVGAASFWQRDKISALFNAAKNLAPSSQTASNQPKPKATDRVGQDGQPAQSGTPVPVAQRVVLYEEDPANPEGVRTSGSAVWRTETVSPGPGLAPELAVRADIEIPERKFAMTMSIRRNTDTALPASHTIEIFFNLPADFSSGTIDKVPGILMKEAEQARGAPLAGLAVKVTNGFFLIGLSSAEADVQRNTQLLKERAWFDVPMVFSNNRRAILAIEKGTPGERAFAEAFATWTK